MSWKTLDDMDLAGKCVLVRVDINVPVDKGVVTDATRIERIVPTITDILDKGGKPMLIAHFRRPKGKVVPDMSLRVTVPALEQALGRKVRLIETLDGAENLTEEARAADVLLFENIRFHPGEEGNDPELAQRLAALGDVYIGESKVEVENLITRINAITEQNTKARIYIRGDKVVAYGRVMEIMSIINSAGYIKVALITQNLK